MSKINLILKNVIQQLNNKGRNLKSIKHNWLLDYKTNDIFKVNIFENNVLITDDVRKPTAVRDKDYLEMFIYIVKLTRRLFLKNSDYVFKFTIDKNNSVTHYHVNEMNTIIHKIERKEEPENEPKIDTKKRKREPEPVSPTDLEKRQRIDGINWRMMVSASKVRNFMINDPLLDWLKEYNIEDLASEPTMSRHSGRTIERKETTCGFTNFIMEKGIEFEEWVIDKLSEKYEVVQAAMSLESQDVEKFEYTKQLMKEGKPIIYQPVLHNYDNQTYGCPDLIIRSDHINDIFGDELVNRFETKKKSPLLGLNYHYLVVDIKHSTLYFNSDFKTLRNRDSIPAYKGQLYVYNEALANIQGYNPMRAFILGKKWIHGNKTGNNFMNKLGTIDYEDVDKQYIEKTNDAINWILTMRKEGINWKLLPEPSVEELRPNMKNEKDGRWRKLKREYSNITGEITSIWNCGVGNRFIASENGITSYHDKECNAKELGFKKGKKYDTINQIIKVNNTNKTILPKKVKTQVIDGYKWRTSNKNSFEFYLDFETMNSNINKPFDDASTRYEDCQIIFLIGVVHIENGEPIYKSFLVERNDLLGEIKMINQFWKYIDSILKKNKKKDYHFVHWHHAEKTFYSKLQERVHGHGIKLRNMKFMDLLKLFLEEPITINGSQTFKLKDIVNAMHKHNMIDVKWDSSNQCSNGLTAMFLANELYEKGGDVSKDQTMKDIIHYNYVDCLVLWKVLEYLRENH